MARRRVNTTKLEIIQTTTSLFLREGYSATTPKRICDELDISTGNLTYYFPTKEHVLAELTNMLCSFQGRTVEETVEDGKTSLLAVCMELATMAAMCEESDIARELFIAMYSSPLCLEIIRKNDKARSKLIYADYCSGWTEEQFAQAEALVSGVEYATMMTTEDSAPLETRIEGALNTILSIYNVPEDMRKTKIQKVLHMDCRVLGNRALKYFRSFVAQKNEQAYQDLLNNNKGGIPNV